MPTDTSRPRPINRTRSSLVLTLRLLLPFLLTLPNPLGAQWRLEGWFGDAWNAPSTLTLEQQDHPDIVVDADWSTRPWRPTWYYAARVSKWSGNSAWAFEYMHHKLYLDNPPPEVIRFRITNGVNHLLLQRHWRVAGWELGVGAGPTLAVPVSTVRDESYGEANGVFGSRYNLSGATVMATVARRVKLFPHTSGSFAIKTTLTRLDVPIADGRGRLDNFAVHFHYGLSLESEP